MAATGRFKPMQEQVSSPGVTGRSSNHRRRLLSRKAAAYWITGRSLSSGGHSADPVAGDDEEKISTSLTTLQNNRPTGNARTHVQRPALRDRRRHLLGRSLSGPGADAERG